MPLFFDGIGLSEYRSFGQDIQRIGPFQKLNLFIGQNNSGKSNILRFLVEHYPALVDVIKGKYQSSLKFDNIDRHLGSTSGRLAFEFGLSINGSIIVQVLERQRDKLESSHQEWVKKVLSSRTMTKETELAWFVYSSVWGNQPKPTLVQDYVKLLHSENVLNHRQWQELWNKLCQKGGGDILHHWIPESIQALSPVHLESPRISLIPAIREIDASTGSAVDFSGLGLVDRLTRLQNPGHDTQEVKSHFDAINKFVQSVIGNPDALLEIPYQRDMILVTMDGKTLPLSSLGTGIHEVIILAVAATVLRNQVLCIEEPEIHLHPNLQRKLLRYLIEETDNQYFITTHSAHILDMNDMAIFHVRLENGQSVVKKVTTPREKAEICADLGYHASDLLQSNCIIWVEGPSDRIYINYWIKALGVDLVEGLHYSIMFYGGRLLSHLTANDPEVDEFISLRRLNRNIVIVMDSDRKYARQPINETKKRVAAEFDKGPGFAWISKGREIENYMLSEKLESVIKKVHPESVGNCGTGQFEDCMAYKTERNDSLRQADKVKVARAVATQTPELDVMDLRVRMNQLVDFIRKSN